MIATVEKWMGNAIFNQILGCRVVYIYKIFTVVLLNKLDWLRSVTCLMLIKKLPCSRNAIDSLPFHYKSNQVEAISIQFNFVLVSEIIVISTWMGKAPGSVHDKWNISVVICRNVLFLTDHHCQFRGVAQGMKQT